MRRRIALELIRDELPRRFSLALQNLGEEPLGSLLVPPSSDQNVQNITVLINGRPEVNLLPVDLQEQLIYVPDVAQSALLLSDRAGVSWPELETPEADCLVGDDDPSFGQQILHVSKAECEPVVEPDGMTDDFRWETVTSIVWFHCRIVADCRST